MVLQYRLTDTGRTVMAESLRLNARESAELAEHGFVIRHEVFEARELSSIGDACEALVQRLLAEKRRTKRTAGS